MTGDFSAMEDGNQNVMRLFNIMDGQYNHMKKQIGVEEALAGSAISETDAYIGKSHRRCYLYRGAQECSQTFKN